METDLKLGLQQFFLIKFSVRSV